MKKLLTYLGIDKLFQSGEVIEGTKEVRVKLYNITIFYKDSLMIPFKAFGTISLGAPENNFFSVYDYENSTTSCIRKDAIYMIQLKYRDEDGICSEPT